MSIKSYVSMVATIVTLSSAAVAQSQPDPIRIGVLNDQSGLYADFSGRTSVVAAQMAVDDFGGSVLGRSVEIVSADHQNKSDLGAAIARKWFDVEGVTAIADLTNSAVALAVQQIAKEKEKITLISGAATSRLTNEECSPFGFHWVIDTYSQANGTAKAILREGGDTWFLIVADYAFGHQMAKDLNHVIEASGGQVMGSAMHPSSTADFASYILSAQSSGAKIIGLANGGADTVTVIKQASEFGLTKAGQKLAALGIVISDVHAIGLKQARGLVGTTAFYWDRTDATREWSKRFYAKTGRMPGMMQAGVYSSVLHYLKAIKESGSLEAKIVASKMREMPVNDFYATNARLRADGRLAREMYLFEVKDPSESKAPWDYYRIVRTIPVADVVLPESESRCPLLKN